MRRKIERNRPCPCGSGRRFKRCCGSLAPTGPSAVEIGRTWARHQADEKIRENQQGLGRPIIAGEIHGHRIVAVRNRLYWSSQWKTFPDFLDHYITTVLGKDWGRAEMAKPIGQRHPLFQWFDAYCRFRSDIVAKPGELRSAPVIGVVACYVGLAYSLYLLDHNVELQERLIRRLKNPANFQGAYYELMVANILVRAGFTLTLEDETDGDSKHCEFAATSQHTGKKYWVEAKMRAVTGLFAKTAADGTNEPDPISRLIPHLNAALAKPAENERLIFIDLNTEPDVPKDGKPPWADRAIARIDRYEAKELPPGAHAYLFVTNMAYHRSLNNVTQCCVLPVGLGMSDFNRPGLVRLIDAYRQKQKHMDAYRIGDMCGRYTNLPQTFDGSLPSEAFGQGPRRPLIGETYTFDDGKGRTITGTVTAATGAADGTDVVLVVREASGKSTIVRQPLTPEETTEYKANADAYFGTLQHVGGKLNGPFELFEWFMTNQKSLSRETLLERLVSLPNFEELKARSNEDLLATYCEGLVASAMARSGHRSKGQEEAADQRPPPHARLPRREPK